ncbi:MAG: isoleucine--tRNA ligase [Thermodesulfobacteriota bacterium]
MEKKDYKDTLNLPWTEFQMKARLSETEAERLGEWEKSGLYGEILAAGRGREKFILHDGPPYANGHIHMGHALNKILKDIIVKNFFMAGYATDYVPGWDCHGLPIELQVEKELKKDKAGEGEAGKPEIRKRCRRYAERFVEIQREEFKRLGIFGRWDEPYLTMNFSYQAAIMRELGKFFEKGLIYKGKKPVHWCSSCRTALAEAEVEHAEKTSPSVYVAFPVNKKELEERINVSIPHEKTAVIIWTTTPWTIPANLAIAMHPDFDYVLASFRGAAYIFAEGLMESMGKALGMEEGEIKIIKKFRHKDIEGLKARHPFIERDSPILPGAHVTLEAGTGCVHTAPGHGQDDYVLGLRYGLNVYAPVDDGGKFTDEVPEFTGQFVFKANSGIIELLEEKGALLGKEEIRHSYPHCWRCKRPVIFRATAQWFVSMEAEGLREKTLKAIENEVEWIPAWGRERIYKMIENRPDWCLSRQRTWGVPIPALKCRACEESFLDKGLINGLAEAFIAEGADIWFERDLANLPGGAGLKCPHCGSGELTKEEDILDVWFDSGVSFAAVLEKREELTFPAGMYLEGSDQHRGWFHSSLLTSMGTRGVPPYRSVLTHGFVVDGKGKKMSKTEGNVIAPESIIKKYGAEVLRLWVAAEDYRDDIRVSDEILKRLSEAYRRIRNTFRYILGNLSDFDPQRDALDYEELEELDRFALHRLAVLTGEVKWAYKEFEFHKVYHSVHNYCSVDLSSFYLDAIKDRLYTARAGSRERRAAQTTIYHVLDHLLRLFAPVLVFTTEEAWQFMPGRTEKSVHLSAMPDSPPEWKDKKLEEEWKLLLEIKTEASKALEGARKAKLIGHPLDARVSIIDTKKNHQDVLRGREQILKEILVVSMVDIESPKEERPPEEVFHFTSDLLSGIEVFVQKAEGGKCERCWNYSTSVGENKAAPTICARCFTAMGD